MSDTCQRLRDVPDEHAVATALYATLPGYDLLRRRVQNALCGHLPKALRRRAQVIAIDVTLLESLRGSDPVLRLAEGDPQRG